MSDRIKIATLTDSPKLSTGFGVVAKEILQGFHDSGEFDVYSYGYMDVVPDYFNELPYSFTACNELDELGHRTAGLFLGTIQPDVVFVLSDPGNLNLTIDMIIHHQMFGGIGGGKLLKKFPIIAYIPIEGKPIPENHFRAFDKIQRTGGRCIFYSPKMSEQVSQEFPKINGEWAYHGSDHASFRPYNIDYRKHLRHISGLEDKFVCGSFGVNKRTKGFDVLIYTARILKDEYPDEAKDILFYFHTSPNKPTMQGYDLVDLARRWAVNDMILFKPEVEPEHGGNIRGIKRHTSDFSLSKRPESVYERKELFSRFGFIDRLNVLDLYVDASSVEGWGLPAFEAMRCGTPTISVRDGMIREEIYTGAYLLDPLPARVWPTWHNGIKLTQIDPADMAKAIIKFKRSDELRQQYSQLGIETTSSYKWSDTKQKIVQITKEAVNDYMS